MKRMRYRPLGWIAVLALVVGACGTGSTTTTTAGTTTTAAPTTTEGETTTTEPVSTEPIRIGILTDLTVFTPWAVNVRDGMNLAAQEINDAGGVNGRMIELFEQDSAHNAEAGVEGYERLVEDDVVAIGGIISSTVGEAVSGLAEEHQIPTFMVKSGTQLALTGDSRFMFRTCLPAAPMDAGPVLQYAQDQALTKVGVMVADYPWGHAFRSAMENTFADSGIEIQVETAPVPPDTDFTPFVRSLADFGAEMVVATGHPPGNSVILGLAADLIGDVPVTGAWTPPDLAVGAQVDIAVGRYSDFSCADYFSDSYQDLARRYLAFSDNSFMSDDAVAGFGIVTMVAEAVAEVGDDPVAISEYLHANSFDLPGYAHTMSWTEWGELAEARPIFTLINEGPAPEGLNEAGDWWFDLLVQSEPLEPYVPES